jgi:hypothetical protein
MVLDYMKKHGRITQRDAYMMGIYRLGARIWDLRKAGENIITTRKVVINVDGSKSNIAVYSIGEDEND